MPCEEREDETGADVVDGSDEDTIVPEVQDPAPLQSTVLKQTVLAAQEPAAGCTSDDEATMELFPSHGPEAIGANKRDAGGNSVGRKHDTSATNCKQTLT